MYKRQVVILDEMREQLVDGDLVLIVNVDRCVLNFLLLCQSVLCEAMIKSGEVYDLVSARSEWANLWSTDLNAHWQLLIDQLGWSKRN